MNIFVILMLFFSCGLTYAVQETETINNQVESDLEFKNANSDAIYESVLLLSSISVKKIKAIALDELLNLRKTYKESNFARQVVASTIEGIDKNSSILYNNILHQAMHAVEKIRTIGADEMLNLRRISGANEELIENIEEEVKKAVEMIKTETMFLLAVLVKDKEESKTGEEMPSELLLALFVVFLEHLDEMISTEI